MKGTLEEGYQFSRSAEDIVSLQYYSNCELVQTVESCCLLSQDSNVGGGVRKFNISGDVWTLDSVILVMWGWWRLAARRSKRVTRVLFVSIWLLFARKSVSPIFLITIMDHDYPRLPRRNRSGDDPKMIGLWKVGRTIGKGSSGRVRIARHSKTGQCAAVKIVSQNVLVNPITKLVDSAEHILLSIEREITSSELFDYLCNKGRLYTFEALGYFQQIISAIDYCHRLNIAHRDLKPENLLVDQNKNIKVADFGPKMDYFRRHVEALIMPEVIMGKEYNGRASDIWSCGVILFALLVGRLPFDDEDLPTLLDKVKSGKFDMPAGIDLLAKDLITKMLQKDAVKRITIPEILAHPFYLSQKPKSVDASTPRLNDIARPLSDLEDIDQDILANLRTVWHDTSEEDIKASLKSSEPNWQKGVYRLLTNYRDKHLENYDEEEEMVQRNIRRKKSIGNDP
ncbi:kinase-like domain-containing protein [Suillus fuscotomentosus]|uniref:Kinase-like domain-containing protein n=1 Tax=Suillus fuscotomentosus TaxID=1912939 RepID=A0AAD4EJV1_9AGAM|nr:kinase-like domain-containing protein [Suillus fuscotomentosus]KAG1907538.1 kinase-like domain-containing protein [Suillus fuscotomentosus]